MCLLPLWFVVIVVFERAIADFQDQAFYASVRVELAELNQDQETDPPDFSQSQQIKRTFYVDPDPDGNVRGRISAIELAGVSPVEQELKVVLLQRGQEIKTASTDARGQFTFENVPTGDTGETYTFVAFRRNRAFLAYAIHVRPPRVIPFDPAGARNTPRQNNSYHYVSFSAVTQADAGLQDESDSPVESDLPVETDVQESDLPVESGVQESDLPVESDVPIVTDVQESEIPAESVLQDETILLDGTGLQDEEDLQIEAAAIPPTFLELERIIEGYLPSDIDLANTVADSSAPVESDHEAEGSFEYALNEDGSFSGRVLLPSGGNDGRDLSQLNVFLLQDDKVVGQDDVGENGEFDIAGVSEGVYGLVAAGQDGFAALPVRLTAAVNAQSNKQDTADEHYVSLTAEKRQDPMFSVAIITDPCDLCYCRQVIRDLNRPDDPAALFPDQAGPVEFAGGQTGSFGAPTSGFGAPTGGVPTSPGIPAVAGRNSA